MTFTRHTPYAKLKKRWEKNLVSLTCGITPEQREWLETEVARTGDPLAEVVRDILETAMLSAKTAAEKARIAKEAKP